MCVVDVPEVPDHSRGRPCFGSRGRSRAMVRTLDTNVHVGT